MSKKLLLGIASLMILGVGMLSFSTVNASNTTSPTYKGSFGDTTFVKGIGVAGAKDNPDNTKDSLVGTIKSVINWVLSILGLITLVYLLWGGFQMVTAAGDNTKFSAGTKILKHAAMGLGFIAVSWMIVSMIFWIIGEIGAGTTKPTTTTSTTTTTLP